MIHARLCPADQIFRPFRLGFEARYVTIHNSPTSCYILLVSFWLVLFLVCIADCILDFRQNLTRDRNCVKLSA